MAEDRNMFITVDLGKYGETHVNAADTSPPGGIEPVIASQPPIFFEDSPWQVKDFSVEGKTLNVAICDSNGSSDILKLPSDRVQVRYSSADPGDSKMQLYTHIQRGARNSFFQPPPTVLYVGEVTGDEWKNLRTKLVNEQIGVVQDKPVRPDKIHSFVPKSWVFEAV